jgi:hypothetical protein
VRRQRRGGKPNLQQALLDSIVRRYLTSHDFNGAGVGQVDKRAVARVRKLVSTGKLTIEFGDRHPNPHIKTFCEESREIQLQKLDQVGLEHACLYPSREVLAERIDRAIYAGKPYTLELALGAGQLEVRYFDLTVLERYQRDPRFHYTCNDVGGRFSISSDATDKGYAAARDQVFIQDFGFAYNERFHRAAAAFLRYLADLNREHQQFWKAHELDSTGWKAHPGWWASSMGHWPQRVPLFQAFVKELQIINAMCRAIGWPPLFLNDFPEDTRPREFAFLLRPTKAAFGSFVHLLDKVMSDNLSRDFFEAQGMVLEREVPRDDGRMIVQQKGTIALLEEWFAENFETSDPEPLERAAAAFKEIRKLRQKPAHTVDQDKFDPALFEQQRELMLRAYGAVKVLRLALTNHPLAATVDVPGWLYEGRIYAL